LAVVVSDTSPIRALEHLKLLDVLVQLFSEVLVPPAVAAELKRPPGDLPGIDVGQLPFIRVQAPQNQAKLLELRQLLDLGESEALSLA
jgi:predicted nucleic acid-binding protein